MARAKALGSGRERAAAREGRAMPGAGVPPSAPSLHHLSSAKNNIPKSVPSDCRAAGAGLRVSMEMPLSGDGTGDSRRLNLGNRTRRRQPERGRHQGCCWQREVPSVPSLGLRPPKQQGRRSSGAGEDEDSPASQRCPHPSRPQLSPAAPRLVASAPKLDASLLGRGPGEALGWHLVCPTSPPRRDGERS